MSISEYMHILGLKEGFTFEELKKAYRKASFKWHPDQNQDKSEEYKQYALETMKMVNDAYQVLQNYLKSNNYKMYVDIRKTMLYALIDDVILDSLHEPIFNKAYKDIKSEIVRFSIVRYSDTKEIDREYEDILLNIKRIYKKLITQYCQCYSIDLAIVKINLFNMPALSEIIDELVNKKNNKYRGNIEEVIKLVTDIYKKSVQSNILDAQIDIIEDKYIKKCSTIRTRYYGDCINKMRKELDELIKIHNENIELLSKIRLFFNTLPRDLFELFRGNMSRREMSEYTHIPVEVINSYYILRNYELDYSTKTAKEINGLLSLYVSELKRQGMNLDFKDKTI